MSYFLTLFVPLLLG